MSVEQPFENLIISLGGLLKSQILENPLYMSLKDSISVRKTVIDQKSTHKVYTEKCTQKSVQKKYTKHI